MKKYSKLNTQRVRNKNDCADNKIQLLIILYSRIIFKFDGITAKNGIPISTDLPLDNMTFIHSYTTDYWTKCSHFVWYFTWCGLITEVVQNVHFQAM